MKVTILHAGGEFTYLFGLVSGLAKNNDVLIDIIGSNRSAGEFDMFSNVNLLNFRGSLDPKSPILEKIKRIIKYYYKIFVYTIRTDSKIFHIQWFKYIYFEALTFVPFYRLMGKKVIFTAHNVNKLKRDNNDNIFNRLCLKFLYTLTNHIIVHNVKMKKELSTDFNIRDTKVSINRIGLNIKVPKRNITQSNARKLLKISSEKKVVLFFGGINEYKGVDILIQSFKLCQSEDTDMLLIIAGESRNDLYLNKLKQLIKDNDLSNNLFHFKFIPDDQVEKYFMASDCLVLPYRSIFQSGLHVLSYSFGLPVIATDVGSFKKEDVVEGLTGYICKPNDIVDIKNTIIQYFNSNLYYNLEQNRSYIIDWAKKNYSWDKIGLNTLKLYKQIGKE